MTMCETLGPVTRKRLAEKRRWPAEVQSALDDFEREFGVLSGRMRGRLADAVIARDITATGDINAAVRSVLAEDRDELRVVLQEGATNGAEAGRRMASRRFGLNINFETVPESTLDELTNFIDDVNDNVLDTIGDGVESTLKDAFEDGLDRDAVAELMREQLDNELGDAAAQRHARTLVQGASERGTHSAIRDSSAVGERWVATNDNRTRDTHDAAHGQIVAVETDFRVGGSRLAHPGDPGGAIEEIANCRCTTVPVFESDLSADELAQLRVGNRLNA
jgi:SPP1 gp7 family putative phage head morphogenesis protein